MRLPRSVRDLESQRLRALLLAQDSEFRLGQPLRVAGGAWPRLAIGLAITLCAVASWCSSVAAGEPPPVEILRGRTYILPLSAQAGAVTVEVVLTSESSGSRFRWTYNVTNHSYSPFLGNGFSGFHLDPIAIMAPEEFEDMTSPSAEWIATWECCGPTWFNQFGGGIAPGQTASFSFRTAPRLPVPSDGDYYTHIFGAPGGAHYFPSGAGPLAPGAATTGQPFCGAPPGWLGETAYVIVGDLAPDPKLSAAVTEQNRASMRRAVDAAVRRLESQGYTVVSLGSMTLAAKRTEVENALKGTNTSAIWLLSHSTCFVGDGQPSCTAQANSGLTFRVADDNAGHAQFVEPQDIASWRGTAITSGGKKLRELTILACDAGQAYDLAGPWQVRSDGIIQAPPNKMPTPVAEALEKHNACPSQTTSNAVWRAEATVVDTGLTFVPMLLRTRDGGFGDDLYGTRAGALLAVVAGPGGVATCADPATTASVEIAGLVPGGSITVWMNRYGSTPTDTVPPGQGTVSAFLIDSDTRQPGTVTLGYDPAKLDSLRASASALQAWRFDVVQRRHVATAFALDSVAHQVSLPSGDLGYFLLTVPSALVDVRLAAVSSRAPRLWAWPTPASGGLVHIRWDLPSGETVSPIVVRDLAGRRVRALPLPIHRERVLIDWDGRDSQGLPLPAGIYWIQAIGGERRWTARIVLVR